MYLGEHNRHTVERLSSRVLYALLDIATDQIPNHVWNQSTEITWQACYLTTSTIKASCLLKTTSPNSQNPS